MGSCEILVVDVGSYLLKLLNVNYLSNSQIVEDFRPFEADYKKVSRISSHVDP